MIEILALDEYFERRFIQDSQNPTRHINRGEESGPVPSMKQSNTLISQTYFPIPVRRLLAFRRCSPATAESGGALVVYEQRKSDKLRERRSGMVGIGNTF